MPALRAFAVCFPIALIVALSVPHADTVLRAANPDAPAPEFPDYGAPLRTVDPMVGEVPPKGIVAAVGGVAVVQAKAAPYGINSPSALTGTGIPLRAYQAYVHAAAMINRTKPTCHMQWSLLAAIGRVESDHGLYGGSGIAPDGRVVPPILGARLDGSLASSSVIHDSDNGRYDGDRLFDRAVGPMQFLPGTWAVFGLDADGDGRRDPQDIDDATYAAAAYLCANGTNVATKNGRWSAVYRYNHSDSYVQLVLGLADSYASGHAATFPTPPPGNVRRLVGNPAVDSPATPSGAPPGVHEPPKPKPTPPPSPTPAPSPSPTPTPPPTGTPTPPPTDTPSPPPTDTPSPPPTDTPSPPPTDTPSPPPTDTPSPPPTDTPSPPPTDTPSPPPSDTPTDTPAPPPSDTPTDVPPASVPETSTSEPAPPPSDTAAPSDPPAATPTPTVTPTATPTGSATQ
jgi:hypothetical protein